MKKRKIARLFGLNCKTMIVLFTSEESSLVAPLVEYPKLEPGA